MILSKTLRTPICIDPQFKAIECIKAAHQCQNNVKFLRFDADDTIDELLKAIALGEIVVIEDVHAHIDPTLMDLLEIKLLSWFSSFLPFQHYIISPANLSCLFFSLFFSFISVALSKIHTYIFFDIISEKGERQYARVGPIEIEFNAGFRMYLVSRRSNPKFSAQIYSRAVVINFNTTLSSLENQLLDIVFEFVDINMAKERASLHGSIVANRKKIQALEEGLLSQIASCDGNLLDNPNTMKLLESTKIEVVELNEKASANRHTLANINTKRNDFRLIALKGASIFAVLADMGALNPFYQHAMCDFIKIFTQIMRSIETQDGQNSSIDSTSSTSSTSVRCDLNQCLLKIIADLSKRIYNIGSMGIFQKDKLLFSLRIAMELEYCDGRLMREEIEFLLKPNTADAMAATATSTSTSTAAIELSSCVTNQALSSWLTTEQYNRIYQLMVIFPRTFGNIIMQIEMNTEQWKAWYHAEQPETIDCPDPYAASITNIQVTKKKHTQHTTHKQTNKQSTSFANVKHYWSIANEMFDFNFRNC